MSFTNKYVTLLTSVRGKKWQKLYECIRVGHWHQLVKYKLTCIQSSIKWHQILNTCVWKVLCTGIMFQCVDKPTRCNTSYECSLLSNNWLYMFRTITSPSSGASSHKLYNVLVCSCRRVQLLRECTSTQQLDSPARMFQMRDTVY